MNPDFQPLQQFCHVGRLNEQIFRKFAWADIWIGHDDMKHCRLRRSDPVFGKAR